MNAGAKNVIPIIPAAPQESQEDALYEVRKKIYPRAVSGWFARWRVALVLFTQAIFYGLAWLPWNGRQAVLLDIVNRKFYIFGLVFWPQDVIYLTVLLVVAALSLFLFTAMAGRLFCGYACPQTVYTQIFLWIERWTEGDRNAQMRLDAAPWSANKLTRKSGKHAAWILLSLWTGFTFVGYFTPIHTLAHEAAGFDLGGWETFWIFFYGFATYGNAGFMREQVCKHMCPYARFQSAMFDHDTLVITYDAQRGDPRGARSRKADARSAGLGDCVDCSICVQVCPTGIDIRKGLQYECIGCAACIDACDQVMGKMGYAPGLIRYTTENALTRGLDRKAMWQRVFRVRTLIYGAVLFAIVAVASVALFLRVPLKVDVIRDRGSLARETQPGVIENVYRLQVMNTDDKPHRYSIGASGVPNLSVVLAEPAVDLAPQTSVMIPLRLRAEAENAKPGSQPIEFRIEAVDEPRIAVREKSRFLFPR
jgi:cytochrome c oxidase accessory protein FixG